MERWGLQPNALGTALQAISCDDLNLSPWMSSPLGSTPPTPMGALSRRFETVRPSGLDPERKSCGVLDTRGGARYGRGVSRTVDER